MAAPFNHIGAKVEKAAVAWLASQNIGTENIYRGKRSADKNGPCIIVYSESAEESPVGSGNWRVKLKTMVKFPLGDSEDEDEDDSDAITGKTFDALLANDTTNDNYLSEQLSALIDDFTAFGNPKDRPKSIESGVDGDCWADTLTIEIYCCGKDVS